MAEKTPVALFKDAVLMSLDETFEHVHGMYLDRGTSLFETLATITAEEASRPTSANCASIAAHVEHLRFYIEVTMRYAHGEEPEVDWTEIWRTVQTVSPEEWASCQQRLRETYSQFRELVTSMTTWNGEGVVGSILALLMHNAYHLGEIRHALCTIKPDR